VQDSRRVFADPRLTLTVFMRGRHCSTVATLHSNNMLSLSDRILVLYDISLKNGSVVAGIDDDKEFSWDM
jgi:hypothetical protein